MEEGNDDKATTTWLNGLAINIASWCAIGIFTGAGFLSWVIPLKINRIEQTQMQVVQEITEIESDIKELQAAVQLLRDRISRQESR